MNTTIINYVNELSKCALFREISKNDIIALTKLVGAVSKACGQNEIIFRQDEIINKFGVVLAGSVTAVRYNASGNGIIMAKHGASSVFGEILACHSNHPSPVNVISDANTVIMFINYSDIFKENILRIPCCAMLIKNLSSLMSEQYFRLEKKLRYLAIQNVRERITEYLSDCRSSLCGNEYAFRIPFNREGMAQYLNINRSALSRELSRMKKDGLIDFNKNHFRLTEKFYTISKSSAENTIV